MSIIIKSTIKVNILISIFILNSDFYLTRDAHSAGPLIHLIVGWFARDCVQEETSNIFESSFGYHILKLDEIIPSTLIPFEEAQSDILNILMKRKTQSLFKKYLIDLENNAKIEIFI